MLNKKPKILVVDDERAIASVRAMILESQGYETETAYSGEEAVRVACSFHPDCVVSDIMMGAMNGVESAIEILSFLPQCKVLFISGNAGYGGHLGKARAKGFSFESMDKPVPVPQLLAKIAEMFSESGGQTDTHCAHLHFTYPIASKRPGSVSFKGEPTRTTYAVCLDCGQEFACEMVASATGTYR